MVRYGAAGLELIPLSADVFTGRPRTYGQDPKSQYPKGAAIGRMLSLNAQYRLDLFAPDAASAVLSPDQASTWCLLTHVKKDRVQMELSLPASLSESGYADAWLDRILLPDLILTTGEQSDPEINPAPDTDFPLEPR
jgi:hypothetical protein